MMARRKVLLLALISMIFTLAVHCRPTIDTSDIVKDIRDIENILNESDADTDDSDDDDDSKDNDAALDGDKDEGAPAVAAPATNSSITAVAKATTEETPVVKDTSNATDSSNSTTEIVENAVAAPVTSNSTNDSSTASVTVDKAAAIDDKAATTADKPAAADKPTAAVATDNPAAEPAAPARKDKIGIGQRLTSEQRDTPDPPSPSGINEFAKINPSEEHAPTASKAKSEGSATSSTEESKETSTAPSSEESSKTTAESSTASTEEASSSEESTAAPTEGKVSEKASSPEEKGKELKEASPHAAPKKEESVSDGLTTDSANSNLVETKNVEAEDDDDSEDDDEGDNLVKDKVSSIENSDSSSDDETDDARTAAQTETSKSDDFEDIEPENEDDRVKMFFISPYEREERIREEQPTVRQILTYPATSGHGWGNSHQWGPSHIWNSDYPYYAYGYSWGCGGHNDGSNHAAVAKKSNVKKGKSKSDKNDRNSKSGKNKNSKKSESVKKSDWICRDYMLVPASPRGPLMDPDVSGIETGSARGNVYSNDVACNENDQQCKTRQVIGSMAGGSLFGDGMGGLGMGFPGVPGIHAGLSGYNEMGGFGDHGHGGCGHGGGCGGGGSVGGGAGFGGGFGGGPMGRFMGYSGHIWGEQQYMNPMYGNENSVKKSFSPRKNNFDYGNLINNYDMSHNLPNVRTAPINDGFGDYSQAGMHKFSPTGNGAENQNYFGTQGWGNQGSFIHQNNDFANWNQGPGLNENAGNSFISGGYGPESNAHDGVDNYFGGEKLPQGTPFIGNGNDYGIGRTVHSVMSAESQGKLGLTGKISINGIHKNFAFKSKIKKHKHHKEKPTTTRQDIAMPDEQAMMEITKQRQLIGSLGASTLFADNVGGMGLGHPGVPGMSSGISGIPGEYGGTGGYSHGWNGDEQPGLNPHGFRHYAFKNKDAEQEHDSESVYQQRQPTTDTGHRRTQILSAENRGIGNRISQQMAVATQASQMTPQNYDYGVQMDGLNSDDRSGTVDDAADLTPGVSARAHALSDQVHPVFNTIDRENALTINNSDEDLSDLKTKAIDDDLPEVSSVFHVARDPQEQKPVAQSPQYTAPLQEEEFGIDSTEDETFVVQPPPPNAAVLHALPSQSQAAHTTIAPSRVANRVVQSQAPSQIVNRVVQTQAPSQVINRVKPVASHVLPVRRPALHTMHAQTVATHTPVYQATVSAHDPDVTHRIRQQSFAPAPVHPKIVRVQAHAAPLRIQKPIVHKTVKTVQNKIAAPVQQSIVLNNINDSVTEQAELQEEALATQKEPLQIQEDRFEATEGRLKLKAESLKPKPKPVMGKIISIETKGPRPNLVRLGSTHRVKNVPIEAKNEGLEAKPDSLEAKPDFLEAKPDLLEAKPDSLEAKPDSLEAKPEALEAKPEALEAKPEAIEAKSDALEAKADDPIEAKAEEPIEAKAEEPIEAKYEEPIEAKEDSLETKPEALEAKPEALEARPEALEAKPEALEAKPESLEAKVEEPLEAKSTYIEAKAEEPLEAKTDDDENVISTEAKADSLEAKPEALEAKPEYLEAKSESLEAKPDGIEAKPIEAKIDAPAPVQYKTVKTRPAPVLTKFRAQRKLAIKPRRVVTCDRQVYTTLSQNQPCAQPQTVSVKGNAGAVYATEAKTDDAEYANALVHSVVNDVEEGNLGSIKIKPVQTVTQESPVDTLQSENEEEDEINMGQVKAVLKADIQNAANSLKRDNMKGESIAEETKVVKQVDKLSDVEKEQMIAGLQAQEKKEKAEANAIADVLKRKEKISTIEDETDNDMMSKQFERKTLDESEEDQSVNESRSKVKTPLSDSDKIRNIEDEPKAIISIKDEPSDNQASSQLQASSSSPVAVQITNATAKAAVDTAANEGKSIDFPHPTTENSAAAGKHESNIAPSNSKLVQPHHVHVGVGTGDVKVEVETSKSIIAKKPKITKGSKMSEIERMVHDVSSSIDRTNKKLQAITANNGKRQITPAFTPVVSEPAAVPDIRYPVPAADRYPLGAGYIWPSANYGHQLGGPFAWSKSSTPKGEKDDKVKSVKKSTKAKGKSNKENKKHKKDTTKSTAKKEKRSTEKTESSKSEKKGTKRQFLAHPSYERSTGESYPYHGGMPIYGSGMGYPMSHGAGFTGHAGSQRAFTRHFHTMGGDMGGAGFGGGGNVLGGGYQQGGFHGGYGHRLRASHSFLPALSGRYSNFAHNEAGGGYAGGNGNGGGMPMGLHHQQMFNGGPGGPGGPMSVGGGFGQGGLHGMLAGHDAAQMIGGGHDGGELIGAHDGGMIGAHDAGMLGGHDAGQLVSSHDLQGQGFALGGHSPDSGFGSLPGLGGSLGSFSPHGMGGGMIEDHQGAIDGSQVSHGYGGHSMQFALPQEESHSGFITRHNGGGGAGGYDGAIGGPVPGGFETGGGSLSGALSGLGAGVSGLVSGGTLSGSLDQGFTPSAPHAVDGGFGGGGEHMAGFGRQTLDSQQEQPSGDPNSYAPMMHNQMPPGLMPQMVPEPQQAMFSPNVQSMKRKSIIGARTKLKTKPTTNVKAFKKTRIKSTKVKKIKTMKKKDRVGSREIVPTRIYFSIDECGNPKKSSKRSEECGATEIEEQMIRNKLLDIDNKNILSTNFINNPGQVNANAGNQLDQSFVSLPQSTTNLEIPSTMSSAPMTVTNVEISSSPMPIVNQGTGNVDIAAPAQSTVSNDGIPSVQVNALQHAQTLTINADNMDGSIFHNKNMNTTSFVSENENDNEVNSNRQESLDYNEGMKIDSFDNLDNDAAEISKSVLDVDRNSVKGVGGQMSYNHFTNVGKESTIDDMTIRRVSGEKNINPIQPNIALTVANTGNIHPNGGLTVTELDNSQPNVALPVSVTNTNNAQPSVVLQGTSTANFHPNVAMPNIENFHPNVIHETINANNFQPNFGMPNSNKPNIALPIISPENMQPDVVLPGTNIDNIYPNEVSIGKNLNNHPSNDIPVVQNTVSPVPININTNSLFETSAIPNVQISPASPVMINSFPNGQIAPESPTLMNTDDVSAGNIPIQANTHQNNECFGLAKNIGVKGPYQCVNVVGPTMNSFDNNFHRIDKSELEKYIKSLTNNTMVMAAGSNDATSVSPGVPFKTITMINLSALDSKNSTDLVNLKKPLKKPLRHFNNTVLQSDIDDDTKGSGSGMDLDPDKIINSNRETIDDIITFFDEKENGTKTVTARESMADVKCFDQDLKSRLFWNMNIDENGKVQQINCSNNETSTQSSHKRTIHLSTTERLPTTSTTKRFLFAHVKVHSKRRRKHKMVFPRVIPYRKRGMHKTDKFAKANPFNKTVIVKENSIDRNETVYKRNKVSETSKVYEQTRYDSYLSVKDNKMPLTPYGSDIRGMDYPMTSKRASVPKHKETKEEKRKAESWD